MITQLNETLSEAILHYLLYEIIFTYTHKCANAYYMHVIHRHSYMHTHIRTHPLSIAQFVCDCDCV